MSKPLGRLCLGLSVAVFAISCGRPVRGVTTQTKTIVAHQAAPNVMVLIDRSAAMTTNTSTASPCPATIGACGPASPCPAGCPTRIGDVKSALSSMLVTNGAALRVGVSVFPSDDACGATNATSVLLPLLAPASHDDRVENQAQADAANAAISAIGAQGGMPTSDSLRFVATQPELADTSRDNFVMLFTSGAPDCSSTTADAVAAVSELRQKQIRTIVLAIGADTLSPTAVDTLNQMAIAGGFSRSCPGGTDAECGSGDSCDQATRVCHRAFFAATDGQQLTNQLLQMTGPVESPARVCTLPLQKAPTDASHLEVIVNEAPLAGCAAASGCNSWTFDAATNAVQFQGVTCDRLQSAEPAAPAEITIKIFD